MLVVVVLLSVVWNHSNFQENKPYHIVHTAIFTLFSGYTGDWMTGLCTAMTMGYGAHGTNFALLLLELVDVHVREVLGENHHYCLVFTVAFMVITAYSIQLNATALALVVYCHSKRFLTSPLFIFHAFQNMRSDAYFRTIVKYYTEFIGYHTD